MRFLSLAYMEKVIKYYIRVKDNREDQITQDNLLGLLFFWKGGVREKTFMYTRVMKASGSIRLLPTK